MKCLHGMFLQVDENVGGVAVGYDNLDASISYLLGCLQFRNHAASAMTALAGLYVFADVAIIIYRWDDACMRLVGVAILDAIYVGE